MKKVASIIFLIQILFISVYAENIDVSVNSVNVSVNNQKFSTPNILWNGTTYVPLRSVSESLGMVVEWDGETKTAYITQPTQTEKDTMLSEAISDAEYYKNMLYALDVVCCLKAEVSDLCLYEYNRLVTLSELVIKRDNGAEEFYSERYLTSYREIADLVCNETLVSNNSLKNACYYAGHDYNIIINSVKTIYTIVDKMEYAYNALNNLRLTENKFYYNEYDKTRDEVKTMAKTLYDTISALRNDLF